MENKKLGILLIIISISILTLFISYTSQISQQSLEIGCFPNQNCNTLERALSASHIAMGIFSFLFALGFYLLFFNRTEKAILERLEKDKDEKIDNAKFEMLFKALDTHEQKVIRAVKEQDGITQNTLRLRVYMSKAKLSYVLQELEKRNIITRIKKGKTLAIYLRV